MDRQVAYDLSGEKDEFLRHLEEINEQHNLGLRIKNFEKAQKTVVYPKRGIEKIGEIDYHHFVVLNSNSRHNPEIDEGIANLLAIGDAYPGLPAGKDLRNS